MGATLGNEFWKIRSKHGRDKLFATPDLLWNAACEYFQWTADNPMIQTDFVGAGAKEVQIPHIRPLTFQGLCMYVDANTQWYSQFEKSLVGKDDQLSKDFSVICSRIRDIIYRQKFDGAACGFYNPLLISRDLGLADKTDVTSGGKSLEPTVVIWGDRKLEI